MLKVPHIAETISPDDPTFALVDALIDAGVSESQIDFARVREARHIGSVMVDPSTGKAYPCDVWLDIELPPESR